MPLRRFISAFTFGRGHCAGVGHGARLFSAVAAVLALLVVTIGSAGWYVAATTAARVPQIAAGWRLRVLPKPTGFAACAASDIDNRGRVVGSCWRWAEGEIGAVRSERAVIWTNGVVRSLGTLPGRTASAAVGINDRGEVIGISGNGYDGEHLPAAARHVVGFLWRGGHMQQLRFGGKYFTVPVGLNREGEVVGELIRADGSPVGAWSWTNGSFRRLPAAAGDRPVAINNDGTVLTNDGIWADRHLTPTKGCWGYAMNESRQVVGAMGSPTSGQDHACLWDNGSVTDLGKLSNGLYSAAYDVNERGQVVGSDTLGYNGGVGDVDTPVCWQSGSVHVLPSRVSATAEAINDNGAIVGAGGSRALLWLPLTG